MADVRAWIDAHALLLFVALLAGGAIAAVVAWQRRDHAGADAPIPMLRKRTASGMLGVTSGVFAALAVSVMGEGRLVVLDQRVHAFLRDTFGAPVLGALGWITYLGDDNVLIALSVAIAAILLIKRHALLASLWVFTLLGNGLLIRLLKDLFQRTRPVHDHGYAIETGYSFPSGHAAGSLVFYGMLAYVLLVLAPPRWHRRIVAAAAGMIVLIGASRVALQVHFLSDVCAGYALGLGWLALCIGASEFLRTARRRGQA